MTNKPKTNKWVERVIKFAKEQITMGRNYGWTVDTLSEELEQLITQTQQETLDWVLDEVIGWETMSNEQVQKAKVKMRQTIKQRKEEGE